jgi:ubiquinone/menaquinone biosynthesis C-methylase UbiE
MMIKKIASHLKINSSRFYLEKFAEEAATSAPAGSFVLDAGAGTCPYKHYFSHANYESADFCSVGKEYADVTFVCDLSSIPVEDNRYDLVFCSQTLEHIPEPQKVIKEFNRILRSGGQLWLSAPLFFEEHEQPYDFYRYTQYGFTHILETCGFQVQKIEWLEGFYGTLSYQLEFAGRYLPVHPKHYGGKITSIVFSLLALILKPLFILLSFLYSRIDIKYKFTEAGLCKNYAVFATKV